MVYVVFLVLTTGLGFTRRMRRIADLNVRKRFVDHLHEDIGVPSIVIFPIFRSTAITGLTLIDGKTTATSGRTATSGGVTMDLIRHFTSLALSGWNASTLWTACGTNGGGSLAT